MAVLCIQDFLLKIVSLLPHPPPPPFCHHRKMHPQFQARLHVKRSATPLVEMSTGSNKI